MRPYSWSWWKFSARGTACWYQCCCIPTQPFSLLIFSITHMSVYFICIFLSWLQLHFDLVGAGAELKGNAVVGLRKIYVGWQDLYSVGPRLLWGTLCLLFRSSSAKLCWCAVKLYLLTHSLCRLQLHFDLVGTCRFSVFVIMCHLLYQKVGVSSFSKCPCPQPIS